MNLIVGGIRLFCSSRHLAKKNVYLISISRGKTFFYQHFNENLQFFLKTLLNYFYLKIIKKEMLNIFFRRYRIGLKIKCVFKTH